MRLSPSAIFKPQSAKDGLITWIIVAIGILAVAVAALTVYAAGLSASGIPSTDQWRLVDALQTKTWLGFILHEHNGHRIVASNLTLWLDYEFFSWSNSFQYTFGFFLYIASSIAFIFLLKAGPWQLRFVFVAALSLIYLLSPNFRNIYDSTQSVAVHAFVLGLFASIWLARQCLTSGKSEWAWAAAGAGLVGAWGFSYGIFIPFIAVSVLIALKKWRQAFALALITLAYLIFETWPQLSGLFTANDDTAPVALHVLVGTGLLSVLSSLGGTGRAILPGFSVNELPIQTLFGIFLVAAFGANIFFLLLKRKFSEAFTWSAIFFISLTSSGLIFIGRTSSLNIAGILDYAASPRYLVVGYLCFFATAGALYANVGRVLSNRLKASLLVGLSALLGLSAFISLEYSQTQQRYFLFAMARTHTANLSLLGPEGARLPIAGSNAVQQARLRVADRIALSGRRLGVFSDPAGSYLGRASDSMNHFRPIEACQGAVVEGFHQRGDMLEIRIGVDVGERRFDPGLALLTNATGDMIEFAGVTGLFSQQRLNRELPHLTNTVLFQIPYEESFALSGRHVFYRPAAATAFCQIEM